MQADTSRSTSAREIELEKKERELKRKEEEVRKKEAELVASGALAPKRNWPGLCLRFLYHDIAAEVPAAQQRMVRFVYYSWFGLIAALGMNLLAGCFILGSDAKDKVGSWFLNLTYFVLGVPLSFWMWYWRLYNGVKSDRAFSYVGFFIGYLIHVAYCIWAAIAIPILAARWSFAGFVTMIKAFDVGQVYGFVFLVGAIVWTLEALWSLWCLRSVYLSFRGRGGPEAAKKEALKATISAATKV